MASERKWRSIIGKPGVRMPVWHLANHCGRTAEAVFRQERTNTVRALSAQKEITVKPKMQLAWDIYSVRVLCSDMAL